MKVLGLGNALVDILVQLTNDEMIQELGYPKGSMQLIGEKQVPIITTLIKNHSVIRASGGSAANTIHGLAKLGTKCGFIGKVGNDEYGTFYEKDLKEAGVDALLCQSATETGRSFALVSPDSERTFATYLGAAIELSADDLIAGTLKNYDLLHVEGYIVQNPLLLETALRIAKTNGLMISLDLASFNVVEANHKFLAGIIPTYVDILFANEDEAKAYTGKKPAEALDEISGQVKVAVVKTGRDGSLVRSGHIKAEINIIPVKSVDTTGAGDQYAAGFLHGYLNNLDLVKCGKIGSLLAGKVILNYGARIPQNYWADMIREVNEIIEG